MSHPNVDTSYVLDSLLQLQMAILGVEEDEGEGFAQQRILDSWERAKSTLAVTEHLNAAVDAHELRQVEDLLDEIGEYYHLTDGQPFVGPVDSYIAEWIAEAVSTFAAETQESTNRSPALIEAGNTAQRTGDAEGTPAQGPSGIVKGVSLRDAAIKMRPNDPGGQDALNEAWRKSRNPKPPVPIGKAPEHSQRNLFEPAALLEFLKKVEGRMVDRDFGLSAHFRRVSRIPVSESPK